MAPGRAYDAGNAPRALAPPAISKASAAGTGNPIASRNTATNRITKPCAARFEVQVSMTVRAVLSFETSTRPVYVCSACCERALNIDQGFWGIVHAETSPPLIREAAQTREHFVGIYQPLAYQWTVCDSSGQSPKLRQRGT